MKIVIVDRNSLEWETMWSALGSDPVEEHPVSGECWQYMGSIYNEGRWLHEFRHRDHPVTGSREYRHIPATSGFSPDQK